MRGEFRVELHCRFVKILPGNRCVSFRSSAMRRSRMIFVASDKFLGAAKTSFQPYLLMTHDGMRHIRLFQVCDLFLGQFNGQSANGIFQMLDLRCPDDRRRHRLLL
jgi:hypothetical protein